MRGKGIHAYKVFSAVGITPAYAGKSFPAGTAGFASWDHPRLCGEKGEQEIDHVFYLGSPPPMRGKANFDSSFELSQRITPAYAGKSLRSSK